MKIVEQFIAGKSPDQNLCEDGIFVNDHYVAVIDGATSATGRLWGGKKTGRIAMEVMLAKIPDIEPDLDAASFMLALNEAIADWYRLNGVYDAMQSEPSERCIAQAVVYSKSKDQVWFLGDCQAIIDDTLHVYDKYVDAVIAEARVMYVEAELQKGKTIEDLLNHDTGNEYVQPLIQQQYYFQNTESDSPFAHVQIDGFITRHDADTTEVIDISSATQEIILASDGYPFLKKSLQKSEEALRALLAEDPLLYRTFKSVKGLQTGNTSFDDRAYIRITL